MDVLDLSILGALERDARQSFASLSQTVGLSKTPCWARVQELEKSGAIRGYYADINPRAVGLGVFAFIAVKIDFIQRQAFEIAASNNAAILECYTTAGEGDYLLKIVCRDVDDLDDLLRFNISLLPGLQRSTTMICLKTVKARSSTTAAAETYVVKTRKR